MRAIIIEDEKHSRLALENMVRDYCHGVEIIMTVDSVKKGVDAIRKHQPEMIFLDIEFPGDNGFSIFDYFPDPTFEVVFTTAYDSYALQALRMSAIDYLLKPIDLEDLQIAIDKVKDKKVMEETQTKLNILKGNLNNQFQKLALPTNDGYSFVEIEDIVRCEAQGNYTLFTLQDAEKILVCRTLKIFDEVLGNFNFVRISRSSLINLKFIKKFTRKKTATVTMSDGSTLNVSAGRREDFLNLIENLI